MPAKTPENVLDEVCRLYVEEGFSIQRISEITGLSWPVINPELKRRGIAIRKIYRTRSLNENFFEAIDSEVKAYWFGFIAADGCNSGHGVQINLKRQDRDHLQKFLNDIGSSSQIVNYVGRAVAFTGNRERHYSRVGICSLKVARDLARHGVTEKKSLTLNCANSVPKDLLHHFYRGLIDGDGSISKDRTGHEISLCGSQFIVGSFAAWAREHCNTTATARPSKKIWRVKIRGNRNCQLLTQKLYGDATVSLPRKMALAQTILDLEVKKKPNVDCAEILKQYQQGVSAKQLARNFEIAEGTVRSTLLKAGAVIRNRKEASKIAW